MTKQQLISQTDDVISGVIKRWCPEFSQRDEPIELQVIRVLLALNAYEHCAHQSLRGERPDRTSFPLPLPTKS